MGHRFEVQTRGGRSPARIFTIDSDLTSVEQSLVSQILADPVLDEVAIDSPVIQPPPANTSVIHVTRKPGVTDPEGYTIQTVLSPSLGRDVGRVAASLLHVEPTGWRPRDLGNPLIRNYTEVPSDAWDPAVGIPTTVPEIPNIDVPAFTYVPLGTDSRLDEINTERELGFSLPEFQTIRTLFEEDTSFVQRRKVVGLKSVPTDAELESLAQAWSEHCKHKKFNAKWIYTSDDVADISDLPYVTDNMFKRLIKDPMLAIAADRNDLISLFEDNAGVRKLNTLYNIAHKVETHNHPSGLDGFGGANTGSGGVFRDPGATGLFMRLVSSQWGFRVPTPKGYIDLPLDMEPPKEMLEGIIHGVEDYGNKMGIATMLGSLIFHDGWLKPAVYVGAVAVAPSIHNSRPTHIKQVKEGYIAISLGGRVGKDGIHGATASSSELAAGAESQDSINQSVQIGAPLTEKLVFDALEALFQQDLIQASQDCGAGGWNSAIGELAGYFHDLQKERHKIKSRLDTQGITATSPIIERTAVFDTLYGKKVGSMFYDTLKHEVATGEIFQYDGNGIGGVRMDLTHAPTKYPGLMGWEKLVSESQERMVIVVKQEDIDRVTKIAKHFNIEATQLAEFTSTGDYHVLDQDQTIAYLPIDFMEQGLPQLTINAHWSPPDLEEPEIQLSTNLTGTLHNLIARPNLQSLEPITSRYDHEVQGGSLIKPLVGIGKGRSDAIAYRPILDQKEVVIETQGSNPLQSKIDGYHMGSNNVVAALGKVVAAGGRYETVTFNGNTTCPRPESDPAIAATVLRIIKGATDAELFFDTPTTSGKDSTSMARSYTSTNTGEEVQATALCELLMSALAISSNADSLVTCDVKLPGDLVYIVGETEDELGASEFYSMHGEVGKNIPQSNFEKIKATYEAMQDCTNRDVLHSAQYISRGGLGFALANSSIAGNLGVDIDLTNVYDDAQTALFSESTGRFVVTIHPSQKATFEYLISGTPIRNIGTVRGDQQFNVTHYGSNIIKTDISTLKQSNRGEIQL